MGNHDADAFAFWRKLAPLLLILAQSATAADIATRFPDPQRVAADFPDDVQRYVAFEVLDHALSLEAPRPQSPLAYQKNFAYGQSDIGIDNAHMRSGIRSPEYRQWAADRDRLLTDTAFRQSILDKYHLPALPAPVHRPSPTAPASSLPGNERTTGPLPFNQGGPPDMYTTTQQIADRAFGRALPVTLPSLVAMLLLPWLMIRRSGIREPAASATPSIDPRLPPLPASLRIIRLPAVHYPIETRAAKVIDCRTTYETTRTTWYTPGPTYGSGNQTYQGPGTVTTHVRTTQYDALRVATAAGESTWTLIGGGFEVFPGQIISSVLRLEKDGHRAILLVYNHNTGALGAQVRPMSEAHVARGFGAQSVAFFTGVIGCTALVAYALACGMGNLLQISMEFLQVMLVPGSILCLTIAFFWTRWLKYAVPRDRNKRFMDEYGPQFRRYFEQCTPALRGIFGG